MNAQQALHPRVFHRGFHGWVLDGVGETDGEIVGADELLHKAEGGLIGDEGRHGADIDLSLSVVWDDICAGAPGDDSDVQGGRAKNRVGELLEGRAQFAV